ncbi:hypothetical protein [Altererythrobacter sp. GH1-8]|uniref:hypothetical protein n=1 Tax=Altererythrobacter sp. GH1-8 TaxID=3349333 RepID=UPI00374D24CA
MKKYAIPAAAAALMASSGVAQAEPGNASPDLDCAIFVAITIDSVNTEDDPEAAMGLAAGLTYFIGRYEGRGGTDLQADLMARFETMSLEDLAGLEGKCGPELERMGERLQVAGQAFVAAGEEGEVELAPEAEDALSD